MSKKNLVIIDGIRTPFLKMGTGFARVGAVDQARAVTQTLLTRNAFDPTLIDEVLFGCVSQPADSANIARVIALRSGIPKSTPAMTVHRNCGSGLEALTTAAERAAVGRGEVFIVGGTENMSRIPLIYSAAAASKFSALARAKSLGQKAAAALRFRPADFAPIIGLKLGLTDPVSGLGMGETAEVLAREFDISRDQQDNFALASHHKTVAAREHLRDEIEPFYLTSKNSAKVILDDNGPRENQSLEALAKLRPVFEKHTGTVTAGNASQITDGAVALLVMTETRAEKLGLEPLGRLVDYEWAGCDPKRMGLGPAYAIRQLAERTGLKPDAADIVEINEAFAAQVLAVLKMLERDDLAFDLEKLNPNGGSIALGHPVGATGARLVLTALNELKRTGNKRALVSMCIGGGQGGAAWLERI